MTLKKSKTKTTELDENSALDTARPVKIKPKDKPHYVNNAQFSQAVVDYCTTVQEAKESGKGQPIIPDYIATCFLKICEGLSHKANFVRAFLRRIEKEKKQQDIKMKYMEQSGIENFLDQELGDAQSRQVAAAFVDQLRFRIDEIKDKDKEWKEIVKKERKRRTVKVDSDLGDFIDT